MSSDSSDEENLDLLKEATDFQFINDRMFKENAGLKTAREEVVEKLPSLRKTVDEDEQYNLFRVTPEFRNYVAKQLSSILEENLQKQLKTVKNTEEVPTKRRRKSGVKLFKDSNNFLKATSKVSNVESTVNSIKVNRYPKLVEELPEASKERLLKEIAVSPEDILSKRETKSWSQRTKAPVYRYKKSKNNELVLIEPEFK